MPVPAAPKCSRIVLILIAALFAHGAGAQVPAAPEIGATSYVLMDFHSGELVAEKAPDLSVEPASITKLMTAYIAFGELAAGRLALDDQVQVSEKAWRTGGSRMFIEVNSSVSVEDLLKGIIIQSGNDASVALAEHIAGSEEVFAQMMNAEAERLGMNATHYENSTGLPHPDHLTSARDIALLARAMIAEFPQYYGWYSEPEFSYNGITQQNRNLLLRRDDSVDGLKTGHTESAGYCLATSAEREGMRLISVVMGTASEQARASASQALLNYGFRFFETFKLYSAGEQVATAPVWKGQADEVSLGLVGDVYTTVPRGRQDSLTAELNIPSYPVAPFERGQTLGSLVISFDGEPRIERALTVLESVAAAGWWGRTTDGLGLWFKQLWGDES